VIDCAKQERNFVLAGDGVALAGLRLVNGLAAAGAGPMAGVGGCVLVGKLSPPRAVARISTNKKFKYFILPWTPGLAKLNNMQEYAQGYV